MIAGSLEFVLVIGHFGGHNTGDEAMLAGMLQGLTKEERARLRIVTRPESCQELREIHGVETIPASLTSVLPALWRAAGLVLAGGTHFHDDYRPARYIRHVRYLSRILIAAAVVRLRRRPVLWLGVGIGPINRRLTRFMTRLGLHQCTAVSVRDESSHDTIGVLTDRVAPILGFDLAARITRARPTFSTAKPGNSTAVLGVSVTPLSNRRGSSSSLESRIWDVVIQDLHEFLTQHPNLQVRVFTIRGGNREDDYALSNSVVERLASHNHDVSLVPYQPDPIVMFDEIRSCTHFVATRFHAALLAYLAGCRLLLLAYHHKVRALADEIGLGDEAVVELTSAASLNRFSKQLSELLAGQRAFAPTLAITDAVDGADLACAPLSELLRTLE